MFACCSVPKAAESKPSNKTYRNDRLEFLVILDGDDEQPINCLFSSLKEKVLKYSNKLQGKLHVADIQSDKCSCCDTQYIIQDVISTRKLYAKLPKENIYIELSKFEHEYIKSKMEELIYIFRKLGARELDITINKDNGQEKETSGFIEASLGFFGLGAGISYSHAENDLNNIQIHLEFEKKEDKEKISEQTFIDSFYNDPHIHYLHNHPDWQGFINGRIIGKMKQIDFVFIHSNAISINRNVQVKLEKIGIEYGSKHNSHVKSTMLFKCSFEDNKKKRFNTDSTNEE